MMQDPSLGPTGEGTGCELMKSLTFSITPPRFHTHKICSKHSREIGFDPGTLINRINRIVD